MNITNKNIDSLIFAEYNPRQLGIDEYKHLKDSIDRLKSIKSKKESGIDPLQARYY